MFKSPFLRSYGFWHWGEGLQTVLFTWYMTFHAELSASEIGFYQALVLAPFLLVTVAGGALTDKIGARTSYSISTTLFAAVLIGYGFVDWVWGFVPLLFFIYCVLAGITSAISNPAIDTFIPEIGASGAQQNSLQAASAHNVAKLSGNITGLALPLFSALGGFVSNGLLMLASVFYLRKHQPATQPTPSSATEQKPSGHSIARAIAHYRDCPENFDLLLSSCMLGLLIVPAGYILWPLVMRERFPEHGDWIALINISSWIGAIASTLYFQRFSHRVHRPGLLALALWTAAALIGLLMLSVQSFVFFCLIKLMLGACYAGKPLVYGRYLHNAPDADRALLIAVDQTAFWGLATVGTFLQGTLVDSIGLQPTIIGNAALILCCVSGLLLRGHFSKIDNAT